MRKIGLPLVAGAALLAGGTAHAQSFVYDVTWDPVESIGGLEAEGGPQYQGGSVTGTYTATYADGSEDTGSVKCIGMDQPDGGVFAIHLTCNVTGREGNATSVYGCNFLGPRGPDTPLGCVGGIQGRTGPFEGRRGGLTMEWYSDEKSRGTGQWYGAGE